MVGLLRSFRVSFLALAAAVVLIVSLPTSAFAKSVTTKRTHVKTSTKCVAKHPWSKPAASKKGASAHARHRKPTKSYAKHPWAKKKR